jgi:hypothetical protein
MDKHVEKLLQEQADQSRKKVDSMENNIKQQANIFKDTISKLMSRLDYIELENSVLKEQIAAIHQNQPEALINTGTSATCITANQY